MVVVAERRSPAGRLGGRSGLRADCCCRRLTGVRPWSTPRVPVLVPSAASRGCALLMAGALFAEGDEGVRKVAQAAARAPMRSSSWRR
ncbi:MAG: hypothetical protein ACLTDR_01160 [Adlercreutzia equolifaciens]